MPNISKKIVLSASITSLLIAGGVTLAAPSSAAAAKAKPTPTPTSISAATTAQLNPTDQPPTDTVPMGLLLQGHVTAINGNTLSVSRSRKKAPISVETDSKTAFYMGGATSNLQAIKTDDEVIVIVEAFKKKKYLKSAKALSVAVLSKNDKSVSADADSSILVIHGPVEGLSASGFSISERRGKRNYAVSVDDKTNIVEPGQASGKLADLKKGDLATVYGTASDITITAKIVIENPDSRKNRYNGTLAGVNGDKLLLFTTRNEVLTIDASNAIIVQRGNPAATVSVLKDGHTISLFGIKNSDGSVSAQIIDEFGALGRPYLRNEKAPAEASATPSAEATSTPEPTPTPSK